VRDYWQHCGYALLDRTPNGHLVVTDDFLRSLLQRPELAPLPESLADEIALHEALTEQPRLDVAAQVAALRDEDARGNYEVWLRFRTRLLAQPTLEASYMGFFRQGVDVPPVPVHQVAQVIVRHLLGGEATAMQARVAEMLFRTQRIAVQDDGQVMAADDETVERHAVAANFGAIGELLRQGGAPMRSAELDVMREDNQDIYWERADSHDLVISLNHGEPALVALCQVLERWVHHFLETPVRITVERDIDDDQWVWHVGMDAEASSVLNDLYRGEDVSAERMAGMLCLFKLEFEEPSVMRPEVAGKPVYLAMAMDAGKRLKLKPQNLLMNLPVTRQ
jgi:hypothetical protein